MIILLIFGLYWLFGVTYLFKTCNEPLQIKDIPLIFIGGFVVPIIDFCEWFGDGIGSRVKAHMRKIGEIKIFTPKK